MESKIQELPPMQRKIYLYIKDYYEHYGYAPSVRDIGKAIGLTATSTVHGHLTRLEKKGLIERGTGKSRAIRVIDTKSKADKQSLSVPLLDKISANKNIFTDDNIITYLPMPGSLLPEERLFAIKAEDDSMRNAGFSKSDIIIAIKQDCAVHGDLIIAVYNSKTIIGTYSIENDIIKLLPKYDNAKPIPVLKDDLYIIGIITAVIRRIK